MREEDLYRLWLCSIPDLAVSRKNILLQYFGSDRELFLAEDKEFAVWKAVRCDWIDRVIKAKQTRPETIAQQLERLQIDFVSREDPLFPQKLRDLGDCPLGLFYRGQLPRNGCRSIAVVGARSCSLYGRRMAEEISRELALRGTGIVSGMALGIDGASQYACIRAGMPSYAVLGCGADICYPVEHFELYDLLGREGKGCVLSEFPCKSRPFRTHFPQRNRLIAALSDLTIVVEAREQSGSLITADLALDLGRDVYAVPGRSDDPLSKGCNRLIAQGAGIITSTEDLIRNLEETGYFDGGRTERAPSSEKGSSQDGKKSGKNAFSWERNVENGEADPYIEVESNLSSDRRERNSQIVYRILEKNAPVTVEEIMEKCSLSMEHILESLLFLQIRGKAGEVGKGHFCRLS